MERLQEERGVALLLALLFVVLLSAIVVDYSYEMQVEATMVGSRTDDLEAYVAAQSAVAQAYYLLAMDLLAGSAVGGATVSNSDSLLDGWAQGVQYTPINNAAMMATITDEAGKLNLNALIDRTNTPNVPNEALKKILSKLFELRQVQVDPTDAIIDWLDDDDEATGSNGAESDYYTSLTTPYVPQGGPMVSIEELLLIAGITPELYFFEDQEQGIVPLSDLLTVHGESPQPAPGDPTPPPAPSAGKININTAEPELLEAIGEALDGKGDLGRLVDERRENSPFESDSDITNLLTGYPESAKIFGVQSSVFRIYGDGEAGDPSPVRVRIEAFVRRAPATPAKFNVLYWRVIR